jgi:hypothetical protein
LKTIIVSDKRAAELVEAGDAEYASGDAHIAPALPLHVAEALPPVKGKAVNGKRVDLPCPQGTPGTVTLSATGHTLSLADPSKEMFAGYCERVAEQADGNPNIIGDLVVLGTSPWFERFGGFKADGSNWPQAADYFFDTMSRRVNYMTAAERVADQHAREGFTDVGKQISANAQVQQPQTPLPTKTEPQELGTTAPSQSTEGGEEILQPNQQ